jgi:hypothetical protein
MESRMLYLSDLAAKVAQDPQLASELKDKPAETLARLAAPLTWDFWIYRMVVLFLGLTVLAGVIGAIILSLAGKDIPEALVALGAAAVGALAGLLAPSPAAK